MSSQESFSLLLENQPTQNWQKQVGDQIGEHSKDTSPKGLKSIDILLEPICFIDIVSEMESFDDPIETSNDSLLCIGTDNANIDLTEDIVNTDDCDDNSSFNIFNDVQEAEENNQTNSSPKDQANQSDLEILQNHLTVYETLLEKKTQENEEMEENHKNALAYKQSIIENLTQKLKSEKDAQKVLIDGKRIQIDCLKKDSARLSKENDKLLAENVKLKQEVATLHQSSISRLKI